MSEKRKLNSRKQEIQRELANLVTEAGKIRSAIREQEGDIKDIRRAGNASTMKGAQAIKAAQEAIRNSKDELKENETEAKKLRAELARVTNAINAL